MLRKLLHPEHEVRIFFFSGLTTILGILAVLIIAGPVAALIAISLIIIEVTFSFDNAIINARVLRTLSPFWQKIFLTVGIAVAVFGMRIIFPVAIVALATSLPATDVIDLSINHPKQYEESIKTAEPSIEAFGGIFLLMLGLHYFMDRKKKVHWLRFIETPLSKTPTQWFYSILVAALLVILSVLPSNHHPRETIIAGSIGLVVYLLLHGLSEKFSTSLVKNGKTAVKTGTAAFVGFIYLEVLDASFSLDSVIGAFAITNNALLIAAGLGIGAVWVRSLTIYLVRKKTLQEYRYLEQGAHWAILVLALTFIIGIFADIPGVAAGVIGMALIVGSIVSSVRSKSSEVKA